jgi:glycosyltransferase involved in cell wall biosynthesis
MTQTSVSAVIPTRNRPELVSRAVRSALAQTFRDLEVVVVVDGPDQGTLAALQSFHDERLRVVALPSSVGGSEARNIGVREAHGTWIAFLDDDDEWLPEKIEMQIKCAHGAHVANPVVACRIIGRTPQRDYIWPQRFPRQSEELSEYLFTRETWFRGERQLQTSMIFTSRELMLAVPFTPGLPRHQDTDWYVRIGARKDVVIEFVPEPLAIWYLEENRGSIVKHYNWRASLEWLMRIQPLITPRAFSGFIATQLAGEAANQKAWAAFFPLLHHMCRFGRPKPMDFALFLGNWAVSRQMRSSLRSSLSSAG